MRKVLITGGSGFIGSNFIKLIHNSEEFLQIIIVDKLTNVSNYRNIKKYVDGKLTKKNIEINRKYDKYVKGLI